MIGMGHVYRIIFSLAYIASIWLLYLKLFCSLSCSLEILLLFLPLLDKIVYPRIRTSSIVWGIGQGNNVLVLSDRKTLDAFQFRKFLPKFISEILSSLGSLGFFCSVFGPLFPSPLWALILSLLTPQFPSWAFCSRSLHAPWITSPSPRCSQYLKTF